MSDVLNNLSTLGYPILFLYSLGGGMLALIAAGILSATGKLSIIISILIAISANFIGDSLLFLASRYCKSEILPYIKKHRRKIALCDLLFKKYGSFIMFVKKYIYGFKTIVPVALALTKFNFLKFSILNIFSSIVWGVSVGLISFYFTDFIKHIFKLRYEKLIFISAFIVVLFIVFYFFKKNASKKNS